MKLRGQVKAFLRKNKHRHHLMQSHIILSTDDYSVTGLCNLNRRDRVQLAAIARGNTKWAKEALNV